MGQKLPYIVVPAPGTYGDTGRVLSAHASQQAALAAARRAGSRYVARRAWHSAGDRWLRVYEQTAPLIGVGRCGQRTEWGHVCELDSGHHGRCRYDATAESEENRQAYLDAKESI